MSARQRRLLFVSPAPPAIGGIATWTGAVASSSLRHHFEVGVVDSSPSEPTAIAARSSFRLDRTRDAARILVTLLRALARRRPDLVHVNTSYGWAFLRDGLSLWFASLCGARTILHVRGGDFAEFVEGCGPLSRRAIVATLRRADRLLALTGATREFLARVARPEAVRYVPNFVDLADLGEPPERQTRSGPVEVLFVGWILEGKGVRELLVAAQRVAGARFTLVGPVQRDFLVSIRSELEALGDRLRLLAPRPRAEVVELYRRADVFVLPTWREGFPNVVLEAMAAALPVVATPVGAIPDAVRDGVEGFLVPPREADQLTAAIEKLVVDRGLRLSMGARARARVASEFSLPAVVDRLGALYDELVPPGDDPAIPRS